MQPGCRLRRSGARAAPGMRDRDAVALGRGAAPIRAPAASPVGPSGEGLPAAMRQSCRVAASLSAPTRSSSRTMYRRLSHCWVESPTRSQWSSTSTNARAAATGSPCTARVAAASIRRSLPPEVADLRGEPAGLVEQRERTVGLGLLEHQAQRVARHRPRGRVGGRLRHGQALQRGRAARAPDRAARRGRPRRSRASRPAGSGRRRAGAVHLGGVVRSAASTSPSYSATSASTSPG